MTIRTTPALGLTCGWSVGDGGWGDPTNRNWTLVDVMAVPFALSATVSIPPESPAEGDRYIVPANAVGIWASRVGTIAYYQSAQWVYFTPRKGWYQRTWDTRSTYVWNGTAWELYLDVITPETMTQINAGIAAAQSAVEAATITTADRAAVSAAKTDVIALASTVNDSKITAVTAKNAALIARNEAVAAAAEVDGVGTDSIAARDAAVAARDITLAARDVTTAAKDTAVASSATATTQAGLATAAKTDLINRIYGPRSTDPTTRPDGSGMQVGDEYFNTTTSFRQVYTGSDWIGIAEELGGSTGAVNVGAADGNSGSLWTTVQGYINKVKTVVGAAIVGADDGASGASWVNVQGFINKVKTATGAAVIGSDDGASGATWTTVQGFINKIRLSTGAANVGADDAASGALWTTVQGFVNKMVSSAGSANVGYLQTGTGGVARTTESRLREKSSVKDFGSAPTSAQFSAAVAATSAAGGAVLQVPKGSYVLSSDVAASGLHIDVDGATFTGAGKITGAIKDIKAAGRRSISFGAAGQVLAVGRNSNNAGAEYQGFQIGGGDPDYGDQGTLLGNDGHASWMRVQPSKNESPLEFLLYATASQGIATAASGTNQITNVSGTPFTSAWIGKKFYFGETAYLVASVPSAAQLTVTTLAAGAVTFGSTFNETFHVAYVGGTGLCDVTGTAVTRKSGDPFLAFIAGTNFKFKINGTSRTVSAFVDTSTYTLSAAPGDLAGATYTFEADINDQLVALRVQKLIGSDEENITLAARYDGYWLASQFAGSGKYRALILTSGLISGAETRQINAYANGDLTLGGAYNSDALRILARSGTVANRLEMQAAPAGYSAGLRSRGTDTDVGFYVDCQGVGGLTLTNGSFSRILLSATGGSSATSYLSLVAGAAKATVAVAGATNGDLELNPAGTGLIKVGTTVSTATTPGSFSAAKRLAVKDASGTTYYIPLMASTW